MPIPAPSLAAGQVTTTLPGLFFDRRLVLVLRLSNWLVLAIMDRRASVPTANNRGKKTVVRKFMVEGRGLPFPWSNPSFTNIKTPAAITSAGASSNTPTRQKPSRCSFL
jgi:hypothetical protein